MRDNYTINIENCKDVNINFATPIVQHEDFANFEEKKKKTEQEILKVIDEELNDYEKKKKLSLILSDLYNDIDLVMRAERVHQCSTFIEYAVNTLTKAKRVSYINSCKDRLCPTCQFRRGFRLYNQVSKALANYTASNNMFFMLTLTTVNVTLDKLKDEVTKIINAFTKLSRRKFFKSCYQGYVRVVEIVIDRDEYITQEYVSKRFDYCKRHKIEVGDINKNYMHANVHIHCILHTTKTLYKHNYVKKADIVRAWQTATNDERNCVIDIREIRDLQAIYSKSTADISKAVAEVCKYSVKPLELIRCDENDKIVVSTVLSAISNKRLFSTAGTLKIANVDNLADPDADDEEVFYKYFWHYSQQYRRIVAS